MDKPIESFLYTTKTGGVRTIEIVFDPDPVNPQRDYDVATHMVCWHGRQDLGNETNYRLKDISPDETQAYLELTEGELILAILPLYLLHHSGMTISTTPFNDRWDSGQVGWAYVTKSQADVMGFDLSHDSKTVLEDAIRADVECYNMYLHGSCYGYRIIGADGSLIDSCWGMLGSTDDCRNEARAAAEHSVDPAVTRMVEELSARATYASNGTETV